MCTHYPAADGRRDENHNLRLVLFGEEKNKMGEKIAVDCETPRIRKTLAVKGKVKRIFRTIRQRYSKRIIRPLSPAVVDATGNAIQNAQLRFPWFG